MLASWSYMDPVIRLWEAATGMEILAIDGNRSRIWSAAFSPDGRRLAAGLDNTTILVWDVESLAVPDAVARSAPGVLWDELACNDASRSFAAGIVLRREGDNAVPFIRNRLKQEDAPRRIREALASLDHDLFAVREKAEQELLVLGETAQPAIQEAIAGARSVEWKMRGARILDSLRHPFPIPPGEPLRRWRAIQVLERIGTPEAREVLEMLEKESPSPRERNEVKAAIGRLNKR
jgi:hypothetical protein